MSDEPEQEQDWVNFNMRLRPGVAELLDKQAKEIGISRNGLIAVIVAKHYGLLT